MNDTEQYCKFVSSRGILKSCDIFDPNPQSSSITHIDVTKIKKNDIIYICNSSIQHFFTRYFDDIKEPFILVSGDSDEIVPYEVLTNSQFDIFINSDKLIHWFSINCFISHPKMTHIPYGLDYHTGTKSTYFVDQMASAVSQENILINTINNNNTPFYKRIPMIYIDKYILRSNERIIAYNTVMPHLCYKEPERINRYKIWENQTKYAFVLSPPSLDIPNSYNLAYRAGGFDCIRTWEALILGCIPIVKSSPMDAVFKDLPVWIINDWNEVNENNALISKIEEYKTKTFNYDKLKLEYWINLFNSKKID